MYHASAAVMSPVPPPAFAGDTVQLAGATGAGMFVLAEEWAASLRPAVHTHFKREEDDTMTSGKFDEELARPSQIADLIHPSDLLLANESSPPPTNAKAPKSPAT